MVLSFYFDFYWCLFQIIILKADFNCCNSFALSLVYKVTKFCISYCKCCCSIHLRNSTIDNQVLISQLIKVTSRVLWKLLKYFNYTTNSAFGIPALLVLSNNIDLNLNHLDSVRAELFNGNWFL